MPILLLSIIGIIAIYLVLLFTRKPRGFVSFNKRQQIDTKDFPEPINRDRYLTKKKPQQVETVIIGSGISGMSAASVLSRVGRSCVVLEHHYVAGGWTHQFKNNGYEFETGVHYLCKIQKDPFNLVTYSPIEYSEMGLNTENRVFDKVFLQGEEYNFCHNYKKIIQELCNKFPHQAKEIRNFFDIKQLPRANLWYSGRRFAKLFDTKLIRKIITKFAGKDMKLAEAFEKHKITDNKLRTVLCYFGYLFELDFMTKMASKSSYYLYLLVMYCYSRGAIFPKKGSEDIANKILPVVYKNGNKVLVDKKVKKILLNKQNNKVIGVEMENGDMIKCKNIISSIGISQTYETLLPEQFQNDPEYQHFKKTTKYGNSPILIFVGLKGKASELKLPSHNIFHMPDEGYTENKKEFKCLDDILNQKNIVYYVSSATGKTYQQDDYDKCTITIMAVVGGNKDLYQKWENQSTNHRDSDYQIFKEKFAAKALNESVFRYLPHLKDKIEFTSVGTLLTVENYMNSKIGTNYGLQQTKSLDEDDRLQDFIKFKTDIQGLYLTGQDLIGASVQINSIGGVLAASKVLGYWSKWDILQGRQFFIDFWNLLKCDKTKYVIDDKQQKFENKKTQ